jgi:hypothetical protein
MISRQLIERYLTRYPSLSGLIYVALVIVFCLTALLSQRFSRNAFPT